MNKKENNQKLRYDSEMSGITWHAGQVEFYPEDLEKMESMSLEEKNTYMLELKKQRRYIVKQETSE